MPDYTYIDNNTLDTIPTTQNSDGAEVTVLSNASITPCTYTGGWAISTAWKEAEITLPSEDAVKEIKKYCEGKLKADTDAQAEVILEIIRKYGS